MGAPEAPLDFDKTYAAHGEKILAYLRRLTRDPRIAEELAQETFLRVSRGLAGFRGDSRLSTWVYRIATNVYVDHVRASGSRRAEERPFDVLPDDSTNAETADASEPGLTDRLFEQSEMGRCVREFVDSLPPEYRSVIILHDLQGLGNAEISRILDCSLETVKIRIHRARQRLKAALSEHCDFEHGLGNVLRCDRKQPPKPRRS